VDRLEDLDRRVTPPGAPRVAVIGAGWAGMAAAVTLAERGAKAVVFEAARQLGGRARRVTIEEAALDNGQHILVGAYAATLRLMRVVGADPDECLLRLPLELRTATGFQLKAAPLPAPLHLAVGLLTARGLDFSDRLRAARFVGRLRRDGFRLQKDDSVAALLAEHGQTTPLRELLWEPLCVSALNTPADHASAQVFANVLCDTFGGARSASDLVLPRTDLGALFPEPAARFVTARGGEVRVSAPVRTLEAGAGGVVLDVDAQPFDRAIVACGPQHASALLATDPRLASVARAIDALEYEPIYTVYLQYPATVSLPFVMLGFTGGLLQWAFDRGALSGRHGLIAGVLSASGRHQALAHPDLAAAIHGELAGHLPALPEPLWKQVIAEKRATFSCRPGVVRPANRTPVDAVVLAGDYTASEYPATLEGAVRSGVAAARLVLGPSQLDSEAC
jgi:squalene-associated FAD-dependent desaturase